MDITIVMPISRDYYLQQVFTALDFMSCDRSQVSILGYVDGDQRLYEKARHYIVESKFAERLCVYRSRGLANVSSIRRRRDRIAAIHNEIKDLLNPSNYIFMVEDDTVVPSNALTTLVKGYRENPYAGFVSGVEIGRWGYAYIGGWRVDDPYDIHKITSIKKAEGLEKVDAAGFYCALTKYENYMGHKFQAYEDILGPDFHYGVTLRQSGLENYIDHRVKCRHLSQKEEFNFTDTEVVQVEYKKVENTWELGVLYNVDIKL